VGLSLPDGVGVRETFSSLRSGGFSLALAMVLASCRDAVPSAGGHAGDLGRLLMQVAFGKLISRTAIAG
jgi:hypothetical protein